jgi:DNA-binding transcriptional MocR family regulator
LELVCSVFTRAGETDLVEEASYFLAFNIFRSHGLNNVPVASKAGRLCVDAFARSHREARAYDAVPHPDVQQPNGRGHASRASARSA